MSDDNTVSENTTGPGNPESGINDGNGETGGNETGGNTTGETGGSEHNREAAKYRRQLRQTEAERDALRARVQTWQQRHVEAIAAEHLAQPGDLLGLGGHQLADLLDEHGEVDPGKVRAATLALVAARPGLGTARFHADLIGNPRPQNGARANWGEILRPGR